MFQVVCIVDFSAKVMKKNVWPFKVWFVSLLFIEMLLKMAQLLFKRFHYGLSLCILYFLFHKRKDASVISQPSVQHFVHVFLIFFRFHKYFNNSFLSRNILINKFFHWNMCFSIVLPPCRKGVVSFSLK